MIFTLHGHSLSYVDSGSGGDAVLFVHGLLGFARRTGRHLIDRLDDRNRVIVPDLFGHGASANPGGDYSLAAHAATLRDLIDRLGIDRVTLVGHSLGGGISRKFCYLFPDRVERLVLVGSGYVWRQVNPALRAATLPGAEWVLPALASGAASRPGRDRRLRTLAKTGWRASNDSGPWSGGASPGSATPTGRRAFLATTRAVIDPGGQSVSAHDYLPDVDADPDPGRVGHQGPDDPGVARGIAPARRCPHCRVELFEGAGHFPHLDDPDRFAALVREFIAQPA